MNRIFMLNFEIFVIFAICYLITKLTIKYLLKKMSISIKYLALKLIPILCLVTISVDILTRSAEAFFRQMNPVVFGEVALKDNSVYVSNEGSLLMIHIMKYLFIIWIIGVLILLLKYGLDYFCFKRVYSNGKVNTSTLLNEKLEICIKQLGTKRHVSIYYSKIAETPFTSGIFRPRIIIPSNLSENLEPIIIHELIHCIRHDMLVKILNQLLGIFQWFNPLIYIYALDLENFCELSCDVKVSKFLTFEERKKYAHAILDSAREHKFSGFLATFSSAKTYKKRLYNLLYPTSHDNKNRNILLVLCAILVISSGVLFLEKFSNSPVSEMFLKVFQYEESQIKTIRKNYLQGQEDNEYYYEEYIDNYWWRGTLLAEESKKISNELTEITFSGEIYKCDE